MVQNNKILTVSYGTFSCTLEGFDDSFGTMKAIAEYFRDLAADDRYFGAEPPQPDADMLARIAQREISRQVEARQDTGGGFVLRAADAAAPAALATVATASAAAATAAPAAEAVETQTEARAEEPEAADSHALISDVVDKTRVNTDEAADQPAAQDDIPVAEPVAEVGTPGDSIAAKLQRIRAVVSRNEAQKGAEFTEDEHADAFVAAAVSDLNDALDADDQMAMDEAPETDIAADREMDAAFDRYDDDDDNFEDVVAQDDLTEDQDLDDADFDDDAHDLAGQVAEIEEEIEEDTEEDTEVAAQPADVLADDDYDEDYEDVNGLADQEAPAEFQDVIEEAPQALADEDYDDDGDDADLGSALAAVAEAMHSDDAIEEDTVDAEPASKAPGMDLSQFMIRDEDDLDAAVEVEQEVGILTRLDDQDLDDDDIDVSDLSGDEPEEARLLKIKRDDFDVAFDDGADDDLTSEDEATLMRELAGMENDIADDYSDEEVDAAVSAVEMSDDDDYEDEIADHAHATLPPVADEADEDLSRLMAAAEAKMDAPENSTSRETYSHLRAAVAAAEAERDAGGDVGDHAEDDAYREDLASVVRPRRPVANAAARPQRPMADTRPAPLKLVAEQRVDAEAAKASHGPIRPRRVSAAKIETTEADLDDAGEGGFKAFAADMGATDLPDLLEAAAAYMSFVEGRDQFSRPQLMNKVRQVETSDFNREDGLRSFGQLLREGKIEKTGGGRFTASGDIGFRPDERAAG
ncbi:chemotaxis protein CheA [Arenibacterium sp. CAU 1754]